MVWKCPECGNENTNSEAVDPCVVCNYSRMPAQLVLESEKTSKQLRLRLPTTLGQNSLRLFGDPDVRFASDEQFRIEKVPEDRSWLLKPISWAKNPSMLNGASVPVEGMALKDGDRITIKATFFPLVVKLGY
jgi:hypothetical protein